MLAVCSNMEVNTMAGQCTAQVFHNLSVTATDNCGVVSLTQTAGTSNGGTFVRGTSSVTYRAVDAAGNSASCTFTVRVIDNQAPVLSECDCDVCFFVCKFNYLICFSSILFSFLCFSFELS
jgi:hypothetical protein